MKAIRLLGATLLASTTLLGAGSAFADTINPEPATAQTPFSAVLSLNEQPSAPVAPNQPGQGGADHTTDIKGLFGIAYAPELLSGSATLKESGSQDVPLRNSKASSNTFNVGVQDKTRKNDQNWVLKASVSWNDNANANGYMNGVTVKTFEGNVKENKNGELIELTDSQVNASAAELNIGEVETNVMSAQNGKTMNGVYNYQFRNPQLSIPDVSRVAAGTYSGNITWNLANTPN
ncbi:TPA: WxL domain-containing protein [Enterococcus faecium]|uniref:WxL domain-containing protein n=1 Tax=Enterococcus faecium TaxID=1352 RepID=UPI0005EADEDD|nr:WxL domain-containing protein [Enterococcus faecium]KNB92799.1 hypothetical protein LK34_07845 [Enterococcus faecium]